jgi:hypothetical protein
MVDFRRNFTGGIQMAEEFSKKDIEDVVLTRLMRLNAVIHGLIFGLVFGLVLFIATNWLVLKGGKVVGPNLALLNQFFVGYTVTFAGSFVGLGYGLASGFIFGFVIATLYNWILDLRDRLGRKKS